MCCSFLLHLFSGACVVAARSVKNKKRMLNRNKEKKSVRDRDNKMKFSFSYIKLHSNSINKFCAPADSLAVLFLFSCAIERRVNWKEKLIKLSFCLRCESFISTPSLESGFTFSPPPLLLYASSIFTLLPRLSSSSFDTFSCFFVRAKTQLNFICFPSSSMTKIVLCERKTPSGWTSHEYERKWLFPFLSQSQKALLNIMRC